MSDAHVIGGATCAALDAEPVAPARRYQQLRPLRNGPSREDVARNQRVRLHAAMIETVGQRGYGATTVTELCTRAGVSTKTLYDRFFSKEGCFLATYELVIARAIKRIGAAYGSGRDWPDCLSRAFETSVCEVAAEPNAARLALVEALGAGPPAVARTERLARTLEQMLRASFAQAPGAIVPDELVIKGIVGGIAAVLRLRLLDGSVVEPSGLSHELLDWTLTYRSSTVLALPTSPEHESAPGSLQRLASQPQHSQTSERSRVLHGALRCAAANGYDRLTVAGIVQEARISDEAFFDHFESSKQCFTQALAEGQQAALACLVETPPALDDWTSALHDNLRALLAYLAADPDFARVACVEILALGSKGVSSSAAWTRAIATHLRELVPEHERPSMTVSQASAGAVLALVRHQVIRGAAHQLEELIDHSAYLVLAPLIGAAVALRVTNDRKSERSPVTRKETSILV
jgi:AcrR family transcriptional regulator